MTNHNMKAQKQLMENVLAAQGLLKLWYRGSDISLALERPEAEDVIVEAAAEIYDSDTQNEWIAFVRGDGSDQRRVQLAERCKARINKRIESLRSRPK